MRFLSIKKIAKEAGVSTATVSRVLNNPGYKCSSEELRERIWKIARELNYMPNEAARNLKKGITDMKLQNSLILNCRMLFYIRPEAESGSSESTRRF